MQTIPPPPPPPPNVRTARGNRLPLSIYLLITTVIILGIVAVIGFAIFIPMTLIRGGQARCLIINCYSNPEGPTVPWQTLVATAEDEIARYDKDAVLHSVSASMVAFSPPNWSYDKALEIEFRYLSLEGDDISITMLDTSPTSTVEISRRDAFDKQRYDSFAAKKDEYSRKLAAVQLSPRQAGEVTWEGVKEHGDETKLFPGMGLSLDEESPYWYISYRHVDKGLFELWDMWFDVDAQTGEVLKANYEAFGEQFQEAPAP